MNDTSVLFAYQSCAKEWVCRGLRAAGAGAAPAAVAAVATGWPGVGSGWLILLAGSWRWHPAAPAAVQVHAASVSLAPPSSSSSSDEEEPLLSAETTSLSVPESEPESWHLAGVLAARLPLPEVAVVPVRLPGAERLPTGLHPRLRVLRPRVRVTSPPCSSA